LVPTFTEPLRELACSGVVETSGPTGYDPHDSGWIIFRENRRRGEQTAGRQGAQNRSREPPMHVWLRVLNRPSADIASTADDFSIAGASRPMNSGY
jgi:hypothetical protein